MSRRLFRCLCIEKTKLKWTKNDIFLLKVVRGTYAEVIETNVAIRKLEKLLTFFPENCFPSSIEVHNIFSALLFSVLSASWRLR